MTQKFEPRGFYILVKPDDDIIQKELGEKVDGGYISEGGIFISEETDTVDEIQRERAAQQYGTLVAVGPIAWYDYADGEAWAEVGERVCFSKYAGRFVEDPITKELLILLQDSDIICAIIDDGEKEDGR